MLEAPLVLDINLQSAMILRRAGCNVVHFMPGHLPSARYAQPRLDISDIPLAKGYAFARRPYDWQARNRLDERPIDILFIGTRAPRRDKALLRLQELTDRHRFVCVYRSSSEPITEQSVAAAEQSWVLAQRAKIVLNVHRDWSAISNGRASSCTGFGKAPASFPIPAYRARSSGRVSMVACRM